MEPKWLTKPQQQGNVPAPAAKELLLVEDDDHLRQSRLLLLSCVRSNVAVATAESLPSTIPLDSNIGLAVIAMHTAPRTAIAATWVRQCWPQANILLLGSSFAGLSKELYDETCDPCCNPVGLVEVSRKLMNHKSKGISRLPW